MFRFLFGIQVIQVAVELIKAVIGRQVLVAITQVILAVLSGHVALVLEQAGDRRVFDGQTFFGPRQSDL